ncbi:MAG TPA: RagB/SusD family nutrient uptake outer membrane protein [Saprospiraceae bacterium]|nr:RagB/SusD family nutrient uptake outer membrane protein [Saprospiraceae bacterium]
MKKISIYNLFLLLALLAVLPACFDDLDTVPLDDDIVTSANVYKDPAAYRQVLAKLYGGLAVSGQEGPSGKPDISGIDEGFGQYIRGLWYHQELTTDEAVIGWNDQTIKDFHYQTWDANDVFINAFYSRIFYQISLCNEFLRETTDAKLDERGVTGDLRTDIGYYRAEARFLRALSYWHAMDHFGNVPFVTENDVVGAFFPQQITRADLFTYVESELKAIENLLIAPGANEYGRADQAAAWTLLAKVYLNAEVYTGTARNSDCVTYCEKVINAGYTLDDDYKEMFLADNHTSPEFIFSVAFDGERTKTWGGTTFLVHAPVGGTMAPGEFGIDGGWGGVRTTSAIVAKFPAIGSGSVIVAPNPGNTTYPVLYVPGGYQGWDPTKTTTVLASANVDGRYEGYLYFPDANTEFKFTDGPSWDVNYGDTGADGVLDASGDNIRAGEPGLYKIDVDLNTLTYTLLRTEWGLIGSATPGGWDSDQNFTYDAASNSLVIQLDLVPGDIKFRANDDWGLNYGDNGNDALLERDGANITIANAGNYKITLFLDKPDHTYSIELTSFDRRALFVTEGQTLEIDDIAEFTNGYAVAKWRNITSSGQPGSNLVHVDTDFPMFRLSDVYLMYAEAVLRGGGGSIASAVNYVNEIRERAYDGASGNVDQSTMTLDFILDERARELFWEGHRRTDLIRFGRFADTDYLWQWKGGAKDGVSVSANYNLFPIPSADIIANPNLDQNPGY